MKPDDAFECCNYSLFMEQSTTEHVRVKFFSALTMENSRIPYLAIATLTEGSEKKIIKEKVAAAASSTHIVP